MLYNRCCYSSRWGGVSLTHCLELQAKGIIALCNEEFYNDLTDWYNDWGVKNEGGVIYITGGTGFVGYYLVLMLLAINERFNAGFKVLVSIRNLDKAIGLYGDFLKRADIRLTVTDLRDEILPSFEEVDYIVHTANTSNTKQLYSQMSEAVIAGIESTKNVIAFEKKYCCKSMVYLSSIAVYGEINSFENNRIIDETYIGNSDWKILANGYCTCKRVSEFLCFQASEKEDLSIKILRPAFVYGFNPQDDERIFAKIINKGRNSEDIELFSDGLQIRHSIYITDLARAILMVLFYGEVGEAYNAVGEAFSLREYAIAVGKIANVKVTTGVLQSNSKMRYMEYNIQKLQKIGWKSRLTLDSAIRLSMGFANRR